MQNFIYMHNRAVLTCEFSEIWNAIQKSILFATIHTQWKFALESSANFRRQANHCYHPNCACLNLDQRLTSTSEASRARIERVYSVSLGWALNHGIKKNDFWFSLPFTHTAPANYRGYSWKNAVLSADSIAVQIAVISEFFLSTHTNKSIFKPRFENQFLNLTFSLVCERP